MVVSEVVWVVAVAVSASSVSDNEREVSAWVCCMAAWRTNKVVSVGVTRQIVSTIWSDSHCTAIAATLSVVIAWRRSTFVVVVFVVLQAAKDNAIRENATIRGFVNRALVPLNGGGVAVKLLA